jgi:hypothetical protein
MMRPPESPQGENLRPDRGDAGCDRDAFVGRQQEAPNHHAGDHGIGLQEFARIHYKIAKSRARGDHFGRQQEYRRCGEGDLRPVRSPAPRARSPCGKAPGAAPSERATLIRSGSTQAHTGGGLKMAGARGGGTAASNPCRGGVPWRLGQRVADTRQQ